MIKMICQVNISYISLNWGKKKLKITFPRRDLGGACFTSTIGKAATTQTGFNKNQSTTTNVFPGDSEPPKQLHTHQMCEKHSTPKCVSVRQLFNGCSPPNKFWFNENKQKKNTRYLQHFWSHSDHWPTTCPKYEYMFSISVLYSRKWWQNRFNTTEKASRTFRWSCMTFISIQSSEHIVGIK